MAKGGEREVDKNGRIKERGEKEENNGEGRGERSG